MSISPGTQLGVYEVVTAIGAGGMGEVYRARDTELKRDVAIKVLPEVFAHDLDRVARFRREAEVLAGLNHPNIAAIYGLEKSGASLALVLEYVPGDTLSDRLARGAVPLDDALPIARQIIDALIVAHDRGVVHRDLKPANIKVTPEGTVKVLDFGLAKAFDGDDGSSGVALSQSPTLTSPAMTRAGVILGTAAYMAPEQARGKHVDKRADIWAFGVVLFELLTGQRLFAGDEISDTLAFVLTKEPDWAQLPVGTPPALRRLLQRCLQKDRAKRLADIADARHDLDDAATAPVMGAPAAVMPVAAPAWRRSPPWVVAATALAVALGAVAAWAPWRAPATQDALRLDIELGADNVVLSVATGGGVALSPDGAVLAFAGTTETDDPALSRSQLYVRRLGSRSAQAIAGTTGASRPFFSPDGEWIGFLAANQVKKVSVTGGAVVTVCDAPGFGRGASWGDDGNIVFASGLPTVSTLMIVSSAGGAPRELLSQRGSAWPHVLPGSDVVLFAAAGALGFQDGTIMAARVSGGEPVVVQRGGYFPQYVQSGHLTYLSDGTLFAVPFDPERLSISGAPVPIAEQVRTNPTTGGSQLAVSAGGTLAYAAGTDSVVATGAPMMWLDRQGMRPLRDMPAVWGNPRFSPDGRRIAMTINDGRQLDVWVYDWERGAITRITSDLRNDAVPVWTADGRYLIFGSNRDPSFPRYSLYWQASDGTGSAERLTDGVRPAFPDDVDASGRFLAYHDGDPAQGQRIMVQSLEGLGTPGWKPPAPREVIGSRTIAASPTFSRDGRWLAYSSNESGRFEIYVLPFPGPGPRVQVSSSGANVPRWSPTSVELYYVGTGAQRVMRVRFTVEGGAFVPSKAEAWSDTQFSATTPFPTYGPGFDLHPDGRRFVVAPPAPPNAEPLGPNRLVFVSGAFSELTGASASAR